MWFLIKGITLLVSINLLVVSILLNNTNILLLSLLTLFIFSIVYVAEDLHNRVVYFFFLITFFVFLIGNYMYKYFDQSEFWQPFTEETTKNTIYCLMLSLVSIMVGHRLYTLFKKKNNSHKKLQIKNDESFYNVLRKVSKLVFFLTCIPTFYMIIDKIIFARTYGYVEIYLSYEGGSFLMEKIATLNLVSFYMYLAAMPNKKEIKKPVFIYLVYGGLTLLTGARTTAVSSILIVLYYYIYRNNYGPQKNKRDIWVSKNMIYSMAALTPLVIIFLSFWGYYRVNESIDDVTIGSLFFRFFKDQGGSVNIISYVRDLKDIFPSTNINYTFGPIINFLKHNIFTNVIFHFPNYAAHTVEAALYDNNMSYTITYLVMKNNYLAGIGMGSCYIAELLFDFGYIGIVIFNLILGIVLSKFENINPQKSWVFVILLLMLKSLLNLPRNVAMIWFVDGFNITSIGSIIFLYLTANIINNNQVGRN